MVSPLLPWCGALAAAWPAAAQRLAPWQPALYLLADLAEPVVKRLDGPRKAMALAALAGLVILGFALILLTWLGGRYVRRLAASGPPARPPHADDWADKPLPGDQDPTSLDG